jgi:hypothetical protein
MNTSPKEIIAFLRAKSKKFAEMADELESTFNGVNGVTQPHQEVVSDKEVTLDQVKGAIGTRSVRASDLAEALHTTKTRVYGVIAAHQSEFQLIGRGWIKNKVV